MRKLRWLSSSLVLCLLCLAKPSYAELPSCKEIFDRSPKPNTKPVLAKPSDKDIGKNMGSVECYNRGDCRNGFDLDRVYFAGDYHYERGRFGDGRKPLDIFPTFDKTTRLYFEELHLDTTNINMGGDPANLIIFVEREIRLVGTNNINAIIYAQQVLDTSGSDKTDVLNVNGAIVSGGNQLLSHITVKEPSYNETAIDEADFGPICDKRVDLSKVNHVRFYYGQSPLTCTAEEVMVKLCKNIDCTELYATTGYAYLENPNNSGAYWQDGNKAWFSKGIATVKLRSTTIDPVSLAINANLPSVNPQQFNLCSKGGNAPTNPQCTFNFESSGFLVDVPDSYMNEFKSATISAVRSSDNALKCVPAFSDVDREVSLWTKPITQMNSAAYGEIKDASNKKIKVGTSENAKTSHKLWFDSKGTAIIDFNFTDVGQVSLNAEYEGSEASEDKALKLLGSTELTSAPVGFCIKINNNTSCDSNGNCTVFKKTGDTFNMSLNAVGWQSENDKDYCHGNQVAKSFVLDNIELSSEVVKPENGNNGEVKTKLYNHTYTASGANIIKQAINEVGVFRFTTLPYENYLGSSLTIKPSKSNYVGRFIPSYFDVTGDVTSACRNGFSYMSQPFKVNLKASALNSDKFVTENYFGEFANGVDFLSAEWQGQNLSQRLSPSNLISKELWVKGIAEVTNADLSFTRSTDGVIDGPFDSIQFGVRIEDGDGKHTGMLKTGVNKSAGGSCAVPLTCDATSIGSDNIRFGRVFADNAFGREDAELTSKLVTQYWAGTQGWKINELDNCTEFGSGTNQISVTIESKTDDANKGYNYDPKLAKAQQVERVSPTSPEYRNFYGNLAVKNGEAFVTWKNSGTKKYKGTVTAPINVPIWLKSYWNWNGNALENTNPRNSVSFGTNRGNDKFIYWRE